MLIKPITIRFIAYGEKANIAAIRGRAADVLKDEHGKADEAAFATIAAKDVHAEILATRIDAELALKKPSPAKVGIAIALADVNERLTVEWLHELPVAKRCVAFATWLSHRDGLDWQLLIADGGRWSTSREHAP